ncbi:MAG: ApbE family lipoprotein [Blastopirellula sp.]|nr:MAG: ApbE family lipoprotein [Blastopirellula sp.]
MTGFCIPRFSGICLSAEPIKPQWHKYQAEQDHMGTKFRITIYSNHPDFSPKVFDLAFQRIEQINAVCSDYLADSEVSKLSQASPITKPVAISNDLHFVLNQAQKVSQLTEGAFDVTIGPLTKQWRRIRRRKKMDQESLNEAKLAVGYQSLILEKNKPAIRLLKSNMRIDLGGIAKGYAADQALLVLKEQGYNRVLVDAGGDVAIGESPPNTKGWAIGVATLDPQQPPSQILYLSNCAVATSGDAFQHVEIDGIRYSHIIDPRTARGVTLRSSVTVLAPNCTLADAWASALSVLGPERGFQVINTQPKIASWIVIANGDSTKSYQSNNCQAWLDSFSSNN